MARRAADLHQFAVRLCILRFISRIGRSRWPPRHCHGVSQSSLVGIMWMPIFQAVDRLRVNRQADRCREMLRQQVAPAQLRWITPQARCGVLLQRGVGTA